MKIYEFEFKSMKIIAEDQDEAVEKLNQNLDKLEIVSLDESEVIGINLVG